MTSDIERKAIGLLRESPDNRDAIYLNNAQVARFKAVDIEPETQLFRMVRTLLGHSTNGAAPIEMRVHEYEARDFAKEHIDSAFPNCDAIILCLMPDESPRLIVGSHAIQERPGHISVIPEGQRHQVVPGHGKRVSIVTWFKKSEVS